MNEQREVTGFLQGTRESTCRRCFFCPKTDRATLSEPVDMVVTSSAGLPLDLTFYQAVKGLTAALPITKKGGTVLIVARCDEGLAA